MTSLKCACGRIGDYPANEDAFRAGWRADRKKGPICPACMVPIEKRQHLERVKLYGREAAFRGERIAREKHGI